MQKKHIFKGSGEGGEREGPEGWRDWGKAKQSIYA